MDFEQALEKARKERDTASCIGETTHNRGLSIIYGNRAMWLSRVVYLAELGLAAMREQERRQWISVKERLPTEEENKGIIVGVVNGHNGRIKFTDAEIFVSYCFEEKAWYSEDYDIEGCEVRCWYAVPEPPKEGVME